MNDFSEFITIFPLHNYCSRGHFCKIWPPFSILRRLQVKVKIFMKIGMNLEAWWFNQEVSFILFTVVADESATIPKCDWQWPCVILVANERQVEELWFNSDVHKNLFILLLLCYLLSFTSVLYVTLNVKMLAT
jgi:hypothetical protein